MAKDITWVQGLTLAIACLVLIGTFTWGQSSVTVSPVNQVIDTKDLATKADVANLSIKVNAIDTSVNKDNLWKQTAIDLATAEWSERDYKAIFNVLDNIDTRQDINKVVVKDVEVTVIDVDEKDATVTQELKVYYEDNTGETVKAYVTVTTFIKDNEVDSQDLELK